MNRNDYVDMLSGIAGDEAAGEMGDAGAPLTLDQMMEQVEAERVAALPPLDASEFQRRMEDRWPARAAHRSRC